MNQEKISDIFQTALFQIFLLVTGSLIMMFLFYSIIPAIIIQSRLPERFFETAVDMAEKQKMVEVFLQEFTAKPGLLEKEYFKLATGDHPGVLIWNNLLWLVSYILPSVWIYKKFKQPFNNLSDSLEMKGIGTGIIVGLLAVTFVSTFTRILALIGIEIKGNEVHEILFKSMHGNTDLFLWSLYSVGIFTGILEEVFFRGFFLTQFIKKGLPQAGLVFSSLLFGMVHYSSGGSLMIPAILTFVGFMFGYAYYKSENIWVAIFAHISYNSTLLAAAYFFGDISA